MKRIFTTILIAVILVGLFAPIGITLEQGRELRASTLTAHAQVSDYIPPDSVSSRIKHCTIFSDEDSSLLGCITWLVYYIPFSFGQTAIALAAQALDASAALTLSSDLYDDSGIISGGWRITRDFANMFFIIILLYVALSLVLGLSGGLPNAKKMLASVIFIAVIINFSLFITQIVVDASNVLGLIFYNQITVVDKSGVPVGEQEGEAIFGLVKVRPVSTAISRAFRPQYLTSTRFFNCLANSGGDWVKPCSETPNDAKIADSILIPFFIIVGILYFMVAWAFLTAAFAFIGRLISLWMLMIFAPFAFITYIVPSLRSIKGFGWADWWKTLISTAFSAPIFFFFMLLIAKISQQDLVKEPKNVSLATMMIIAAISYFILFILLKKATSYVQKASGEIGEMFAKLGTGAIKMAGVAVGGLAVGAVTGGAAYAARNTVGFAARGMAENDGLKATAAGDPSKIRSTRLGKFLYGNKTDDEVRKSLTFQALQRGAKQTIQGTRGLAGSSFDARQTGLANSLSNATGMNMGSFGALSTKASAGGYDGATMRLAAKREKFADSLGGYATQQKALETFKDDRQDTFDEAKAKKAQLQALNKEFDVDPVFKGLQKTLADAKEKLNNARATGKQGDISKAQKDVNAAQAAIDSKKANATNTSDGLSYNQREQQIADANKTMETANNGMRDPITGKQRKYEKKDVGVETKADGSPVREEDVGVVTRKEDLSLSDIEKTTENSKKALAKSYLHYQMLNSGYKVEGVKYDAAGNIKTLGETTEVGSGALDQIRQMIRGLKKTIGSAAIGAGVGLAAGAGAAVIGGAVKSAMASSLAPMELAMKKMVTGPFGLAKAVGSLKAIHQVLREGASMNKSVEQKLGSVIGKSSVQGQAATATEMAGKGNTKEKYESKYTSPGRKFFDLFKNAFKS